ncbi:MAG: magnesium transporter [Deltaproteobacteria bacterium]|nr:magnesium transporter [Deltaproteobacteria bacterium]
MAERAFSSTELYDAWPILSVEEKVEGFQLLPLEEREPFFRQLSARDEAKLLENFSSAERRNWIRVLAPEDAADVIQETAPQAREDLLSSIDEPLKSEVKGLLAYAEDQAGGLMSPRYARLRPGMTVEEAFSYLRRDARDREKNVYYAFVVDPQERLLGVVSFRDLFSARGDQSIQDVMRRNVVTARDDLDQEALSDLFARHNLMMIPIVDAQSRIKGVVTHDDIIDVLREEATEDIHKIGGMEALDAPYLQIPLSQMIKKRGGWLAALFLGEMLTATAMGYYEDQISRAVVLALFVPLIISSGGNSGSQASTLVIRAMALKEIRISDWWRVVRREFSAGIALGGILATIGLMRILAWQGLFHSYGEHYMLIALTVAFSLLGVVLWGTLAGSVLPIVLRLLGFDPASASAPFVATLVDVTGLIIYFSVATVILRGSLL